MSDKSGRTTDDESTRTRRGLLRGLGAGAGVALAGCAARLGDRSAATVGPITRTFDVVVDGQPQLLTVTVPTTVYRRVRDASRSVSTAVAAGRDRPLLRAVATDLVTRASDRTAAVRAAQTLATEIDYTTDRESTGRAEFVRYPVETLVDATGDCEDKAVLLAGLLSGEPFGCRTGLLFPEGHCGTLVARDDLPATLLADEPLTVTLDGTAFVYVEAVEAVAPGRAARNYADRPRMAAFTDRWHVLDPGTLAETVGDAVGRRLRRLVPGNRNQT